MRQRHKLIGARWVMRSIFKKGRVWYGRVRDRRTDRLHEFTTRERDRVRAEQRVIEWIEECERREAQAPSSRGVRFDQAYEEFLDLKDVRPITLNFYRLTFQAVYVPHFGSTVLSDIEPGDIERFLKKVKTERVISDRTRAKYLTELRSFFKWARRRRYMSEDPTDGIKVARAPKRKGIALSPEQARSLLLACREPTVLTVEDRRRKPWEQTWQPPSHLFVAILLALWSALRRSNITSLRWPQIDLKERKIRIAAEEMKANADHEVPIHPELAEVLAELLKSLDRIDPKAPVLGIEVREFKKSFQSALRRAGLPRIRLHDLRHTLSTWLAIRYPQAIKDAILGHAPRGVSDLYNHVPFETLRDAIDRMPRLLTAEPVRAPEPAVTASGP